MPEIWNGPLEKIDDFRWRIPKSYKQGMRVDGVIYADEKLLEDIRHDKAAEQVANVAFLPGIVKASLAMPDIHWGYGFCLASDAKVLTSLGFYKPIADFERDWNRYLFAGVDLNAKKTIQTPVLKFLKLRPKKLFKIITKVGNEIKATEDHPLFTPSGMKPVKDLYLNDRVAIFPFQGVEYKRPPNKVIISERNIHKTLLKLGRQPGTPKFDIVIKKLKQRGLLSLTYDHPKLPYILKVMGFVFGDGAMNFIGKRGDGVLHFAGKPQDLEEARKDLERIGYTPSPVHFHKAKIIRGNSAKYYDGHSFLVNAASLVVLLETLGVPKGSKVAQAYRVPRWIFEAPLWQKRLFLASLFGCELRIPHRRLNRRGYFNAPVFPMAKREGLIGNGIDFLNDISSLLKEFGVRTININKRRRHIDTKGNISWALELLISPKPENIFNLWAKVGFEYNFERLYKANIAVQYLKLKLKILKEKKEAIKITIPNLLKKGLSYQKIAFRLAGNPLTPRFITDVCYRLNRSEEVVPRIPAFFPSFDEYLREVTEGLGHSGMVWDEIIKIEEVPSEDFVYDFTVFHPDHNFIANNFVVSNCIGGVAATDVEAGGVISPGGVGFDINCGVRLMRTSLTELEVKQVLEKLVWGLFNDIPAGVGSKGDIKISEKEEEKLLVEGAGWVVKHGYGTQDDLDHTEERGAMEGADPAAVSERAYERGKRQAGTLGSGNHFLEVQVIDEIYDKEAAEIFDLQLGQITVMIHSGSRGLGYQVCDDYTKDMGACLAKYNINVPDRQLA
jgi:tRNA-splicing ligase RtcB